MFLNLNKVGGSKQLRGISSDRAVGLGPNKVLSMPDAVGHPLYDWWQDNQSVR